MQPTRPEPQHGPGYALLWACFLGCSWTWVIGMFIPIMLLRDFGVWGWVAFAAPNVIGAAAMGFVLRRPDVAWDLTRRHQSAMRLFSGVTIAFHLYVVAWLFNSLWLALIWVLAWMVLDPQRRQRVGGWLPAASVGVAVLSWGCFSMAGRLDGAWLDVATNVLPERLTSLDLWLTVPGFVGGFLLCPYLDPTFQRARYSTGPGTGKVAFAVGFGVVFFSMIIFTLMYAGLLRLLVNGGDTSAIASPWRVILAIHITIQIVFTLLAHSRERFETVDKSDRWPMWWLAGLLIVSLGGGVAVRSFNHTLIAGITPGEIGYRAFILAYGVIFPAYVLLCMLPTIRKGICPKARRAVFVIAVLVGYPMGLAGFALADTVWLLGLYAVFGVTRVIVELLPRSACPTGVSESPKA